MGAKRIFDLYRKGIATHHETYLALLKHAKDLYSTGHIALEEASACLDQIVRFGNGEIDANTLETYVGMVI